MCRVPLRVNEPCPGALDVSNLSLGLNLSLSPAPSPQPDLLMILLLDEFTNGPGPHWSRVETGRGRIAIESGTVRLLTTGGDSERYSNSQIDDYRTLRRHQFPWRPPLTLTVRARFSHQQPAGTTGFGFWNEPFLGNAARRPALPQALWFFHASSHSNMALVRGVPGWDWKTAALDAGRMPFPLLVPTLPLAIPFMRIPALYRRLWPLYQRAMHACEAPLQHDATRWHTYRLEWEQDSARFLIDGALVHTCDAAPRGPLGLVIWMDNRSMMATPQGQLHFGITPQSQEQWLELASVRIDR